ncbi:HTH_Tnp_Tc3_2 domain-containing protein [Trichonephila clavipes]|nr:HTH_Tnp_Tc3_2 domain-containing protein [Trichonephila clavipes]
MPLKRRRNYYQQLTEIERGCVIGWSRDCTASKRLGSGWPRGAAERKDRIIQRMAEAHRTASAAEIRALVDTTVTQ